MQRIIEKAKVSAWYRWLLNRGLHRMIPFNKPHGFEVVEIGDHHIKTKLPYKRRNFNHIKGLHACALATQAEFTSGLCLITQLDAKEYRLILKTLEMEYHYQGKTDVFASFDVTPEWMEHQIQKPLKTSESVVIICDVKTFDTNNKHICTGKVHWQVKSWKNVQTKVE